MARLIGKERPGNTTLVQGGKQKIPFEQQPCFVKPKLISSLSMQKNSQEKKNLEKHQGGGGRSRLEIKQVKKGMH